MGNKRRVGVVGYGNLGRFLVEQILSSDQLELAFVWNRNLTSLKSNVDNKYILEELSNFAERNADIIIEVCHPSISLKYGSRFLEESDYMVGSPTALSDPDLQSTLTSAAVHHGLYIPSGAFWGADDIRKMADRGTLKGLKVTMKKHPSCLKVNGELIEKNDGVKDAAVTLYDGPVRQLCPLAPNNVNTMAAAALCAHNLGFDGVQGCLVSDPSLHEWHIVEIEVTGPVHTHTGHEFRVKTVRSNPAQPGNVTASATYNSFFSSLMGSGGRGPGVHLC